MTELQTAILSTAYLPNIQYVSKILLQNKVIIDPHETYLKQSFRNRCQIASANGLLDLSIPVIKPNGNHTKTKDILIDYSENWMQVHWRAIVSAYNNSPFFEFFDSELVHLYENKEKFLIDFNYKTLSQLFTCLGSSFKTGYSNKYLLPEENQNDFRNSIHPKKRMQKPDPQYNVPVYYQVFKEKNGFIPNLSFIDLIFNEGPEAISICKNTSVTKLQ